MDIYSDFVSYSLLISPINGYSCKRITKQNVKQFGFKDTNYLMQCLPGFPLKCKEYVDNQAKATNKESFLIKKKALAESNKIFYLKSPSFCINCNIEMEYEKRHNKFCSKSCSATFNNKQRDHQIYEDIFKKRSEKISNSNRKNAILRTKTAKKNYEKEPVHCVICGSCLLFSSRHVKTCSDICRSRLSSKKQKALKYRRIRKNPITYTTKDGKDVTLDSTYELKVAVELDKNNILWERPKPLQYTDELKDERYYYPDFYLSEYDVYLDPKNDFLIQHDTDKIKRAKIFNSVRIIILNKNQLKWEVIKELVGVEGIEPSHSLGSKPSDFT